MKITIERAVVEQAISVLEEHRLIYGVTNRDTDSITALRAALNEASKEVDEEVDTGGFYPWGEAIVTSCDCGTHPAPAVPEVKEGWQLVPKEPTEEMLDAPDVSVSAPCFGCGDTSVGWGACKDIYKAMLSAAPEVKK